MERHWFTNAMYHRTFGTPNRSHRLKYSNLLRTPFWIMKWSDPACSDSKMWKLFIITYSVYISISFKREIYWTNGDPYFRCEQKSDCNTSCSVVVQATTSKSNHKIKFNVPYYYLLFGMGYGHISLNSVRIGWLVCVQWCMWFWMLIARHYITFDALLPTACKRCMRVCFVLSVHRTHIDRWWSSLHRFCPINWYIFI